MAKYLNLYSAEEQLLLQQLKKLFESWKREVGDRHDGYWFVPDGFYPRYFSQKPRILYMARDAYDLYGDDDESDEKTYIEKFLRQYLAGRMDDGQHMDGRCINRVKFHKMLIQVAYGIVHGCLWSHYGVLAFMEDHGGQMLVNILDDSNVVDQKFLSEGAREAGLE